MAVQTQYTGWCAHGYLSSDPWNYTANWCFGDNGSHDFRACARFPALNLPNAVIQNISLVLRRIDTAGSRTVQAGINQSKGWSSAFLSPTFSIAITSGSGTKTVDLTAYKDLIQSFTSDWYIHLNRNNACSITEFNGDEDGTNAPRIVTTYENATVEYFTAGGWQKCLVHYRKPDGTWQQCIPYYYVNGAWVQV